MSAPATQELLQRIDAAIKRITDGHAPMRIPADNTDVDIVLAECANFIRSRLNDELRGDVTVFEWSSGSSRDFEWCTTKVGNIEATVTQCDGDFSYYTIQRDGDGFYIQSKNISYDGKNDDFEVAKQKCEEHLRTIIKQPSPRVADDARPKVPAFTTEQVEAARETINNIEPVSPKPRKANPPTDKFIGGTTLVCDSADVKTLVDRFLSWPLPPSVCSDLCVTTQSYPHRTGTNLLSAAEAETMLRHVLAISPQDSAAASPHEVKT